MKKMYLFAAVCFTACTMNKTPQSTDKQLIFLEPGHFHASLVMQRMYPGIDSNFSVFAPASPGDYRSFLETVERYNARPDSPTHWHGKVENADDYLRYLEAQPAGSIVVLAGNNRQKAVNIRAAIRAGMHVLSDKPMAIDGAAFDSLQAAYADAAAKNVQLYDMMTERYEIVSVLQRELLQMPAVFGTLDSGSVNDPSVVKESIHHFQKEVAGKPLVRPLWYMDVAQQGEGIVDVTTHLVDLVQWTCFPDQVIDFKKDIRIDSARRWATPVTMPELAQITQTEIPAGKKDSIAQVYANGAFDYTLKGLHARISVTWKVSGGGDTHYSRIRGAKASIVAENGGLFIETPSRDSAALQPLLDKYPGLSLNATAKGWELVIPASYKKGHEASFARVMDNFLQYVREGGVPAWEGPNTLAKYYTTTQALEMARRQQP
ncbi:putative oxidoreductase C-terminal domain-containing protein [Chitinophaga lutea]